MLESLLNPSRGGLVLPLHKSDPVRLKQSKRTRFLTFILYLVLVIVVVFVGFNLFTIYNFSYRSPLLSVTNSNEKPEQVQQEDEQVLDISMEASSEFNPVIDEYMDERYLIQKLPFNDDPYMIKESTDYIGDIQQNDKGCDHTLDRDYRESPIRVMNRFEGEFEGCPIRCIGGGLFNAFPDVGIDVPMDNYRALTPNPIRPPWKTQILKLRIHMSLWERPDSIPRSQFRTLVGQSTTL